MADMYAVSGETLTGIANAIRSKTGSDEMMTVASMASAIEKFGIGIDGVDVITCDVSTTYTAEIYRYLRGIYPEAEAYAVINLGFDKTENNCVLSFAARRTGGTGSTFRWRDGGWNQTGSISDSTSGIIIAGSKLIVLTT